ncbi:MAG TPA: WxcM-like domain-containing protein [Epulopiscium sp.]|nr:WxcM-like domain-containing protein [Candidatus Epulonipiscium sp.]
MYFDQLGDERGNLVVVEGEKDIPFKIERIFYMYGSEEDVIRGQHANRHSEFILINLVGTCKVLADDGVTQEIIKLDEPHKGVYLNKMVWKDMYEFSPDSILLVLSSMKYDATEYIRDYKEFIEELAKEKV